MKSCELTLVDAWMCSIAYSITGVALGIALLSASTLEHDGRKLSSVAAQKIAAGCASERMLKCN